MYIRVVVGGIELKINNLRHFIFCIFILLMFFTLAYSIDNIETLEEYGIEAQRLYDLCMENAPEGSMCTVDYFPQPPYPLFVIGIIVVSVVCYYLVLKEEREVRGKIE